MNGGGLNDMNDLDNDLPMKDTEVVNALTRLQNSLKSLDDTKSAPQLSHYRYPTEVVLHSYKLLEDGASLVHGTSTKYTLMGKIDRNQQNQMVKDLLKGCQLIATGCLVLHQPNTGCCQSVKHSTKSACWAIEHSVLQLVQSFVDESALDDDNKSHKSNNIGAQKTGAVWESCDYILHKKLPIGNRNAIRRDIFSYVMQCNETMKEFQRYVDLGPMIRREEEDEDDQDNNDQDNNDPDIDDDDDEGWEAFLSGQEEDQYTADEIPVAEACIGIVKTSRGSLNALLKACEEMGQKLTSTTASTTSTITTTNNTEQDDEGKANGGDDNNNDNDNNNDGNNTTGTTNSSSNSNSLLALSEQDKERLNWISKAFELGRIVGEGMTDLGATLYPPLQYESTKIQMYQQVKDIENLLMYILVLDPNNATTASESSSASTSAAKPVPHETSENENNNEDTAATKEKEEETDAEVVVVVERHQFSEEVTEIAAKVRAAVRRRKEEAEAAILSAATS